MGEAEPPSITARLRVIDFGNRYSTYGPTPTHRRSHQIAAQQFAEARLRLDELVGVELRSLEEQLEAAGVPWTPGRGVPRSD